MKLLESEVEFIAKAMADSHNKEVKETISKYKDDPKIAKEAKSLLNAYNKLPAFFRKDNRLRFGNQSVTLEEIKNILFKERFSDIMPKTKNSHEFYMAVKIAAIECKDLKELTNRLKVTF